MHENVYGNTIHNDPHLETAPIPINSRMDTALTYTTEYWSATRVNNLPLRGTVMGYSYSVELMQPAGHKEDILHDSIFRKLAKFIPGIDRYSSRRMFSLEDVALQGVSPVVSPSECRLPIYEVGIMLIPIS